MSKTDKIRRDRHAECQGKQRFATPSLAKRIAKRMAKAVTMYRCHFCGGWHIGSAK